MSEFTQGDENFTPLPTVVLVVSYLFPLNEGTILLTEFFDITGGRATCILLTGCLSCPKYSCKVFSVSGYSLMGSMSSSCVAL